MRLLHKFGMLGASGAVATFNYQHIRRHGWWPGLAQHAGLEVS